MHAVPETNIVDILDMDLTPGPIIHYETVTPELCIELAPLYHQLMVHLSDTMQIPIPDSSEYPTYEGEQVLVIKHLSVVLAFLSFRIFDEDENDMVYVDIDTLVVDKHYRRRGYGQQLIAQLLSHLVHQYRCDIRCAASVHHENKSAMAFYNAVGFDIDYHCMYARLGPNEVLLEPVGGSIRNTEYQDPSSSITCDSNIHTAKDGTVVLITIFMVVQPQDRLTHEVCQHIQKVITQECMSKDLPCVVYLSLPSTCDPTFSGLKDMGFVHPRTEFVM